MVLAPCCRRLAALDWLYCIIFLKIQKRGGKMNIKREKIKELTGQQLEFYRGKLCTRQSVRKVANFLIVPDKTGLPSELKVPCTVDGLPDTITFKILSDEEVK